MLSQVISEAGASGHGVRARGAAAGAARAARQGVPRAVAAGCADAGHSLGDPVHAPAAASATTAA